MWKKQNDLNVEDGNDMERQRVEDDNRVNQPVPGGAYRKHQGILATDRELRGDSLCSRRGARSICRTSATEHVLAKRLLLDIFTRVLHYVVEVSGVL